MGVNSTPRSYPDRGLMAAYSRAIQIEVWDHEFQEKGQEDHTLAVQAFRQQQGNFVAQDGEPHSQIKRPRSIPTPMRVGFTSGSVDGVIGRVSDQISLARRRSCLNA